MTKPCVSERLIRCNKGKTQGPSAFQITFIRNVFHFKDRVLQRGCKQGDRASVSHTVPECVQRFGNIATRC